MCFACTVKVIDFFQHGHLIDIDIMLNLTCQKGVIQMLWRANVLKSWIVERRANDPSITTGERSFPHPSNFNNFLSMKSNNQIRRNHTKRKRALDENDSDYD